MSSMRVNPSGILAQVGRSAAPVMQALHGNGRESIAFPLGMSLH